MNIDLHEVKVVVEDRERLAALTWGVIKAWFKRMPVTVYNGPAELKVDEGSAAYRKVKEQVNAVSN